MGAYNRTNGEACCASPTLQKILREDWGFQGHFVSDCGAIQDFHTRHLLTDSPEQSAALESAVLLKNNGILPLDKSALKTVGVIGPNADSRAVV